MRILGQHLGRMYIASILLLLIAAGASAYMLGRFPYLMLVSVAVSAATELALSRYHKHRKLQIPYSGIITGLIIGSIAPLGVPMIPLVMASVIAVGSKFLLKLKHVNIFNPAAFGMLFGLGLFSIGGSWWATGSVNIYGATVSVSVIMIIAAYEARRLPLGLSFAASMIIISMLSTGQIGIGSLWYALLGINYLFAFLMLTEPKTSPAKPLHQVAYGVYVALVYLAITFAGSNNAWVAQQAILISLLVGNLTYALVRVWGGRIVLRISTSSVGKSRTHDKPAFPNPSNEAHTLQWLNVQSAFSID